MELLEIQKLTDKNIEIYRKIKKDVVYLSGAITHNPNYKTQFQHAQETLENLGYCVFNPTILPIGMRYMSYLKIAKSIIEEADVICMLEGWEKSAGANIEHRYAKEHQKEIIFIQDFVD